MERVQIIRERLEQAFSSSQLEVLDDSAEHIGHSGSIGGAGHYTVKIAADFFKDKPRIDVHRAIYKVLDDLIPDQIHALQIIIK
ncbi:MAG: BolA family transcriptional regulator [Gammaproteobacteria bacterium]|nr:BolA family transcriptional regulator [Gammaproteobacteria bacterium]